MPYDGKITHSINNIGGLNLYVNHLANQDGDCHVAINVDSYPYGAKSKRPGYVTYLGTADGSAVNSLFSWQKDDGTTVFTYRASGSSLYYSVQGTGAWTLAGNGTISPGAHVGAAVLNNTLIVGDGVGSTRHSTNGSTFTNTTLAPIGEFLDQFQNRIYAGGTASTLFYSTTGDPTNWNTSGTSDSNSLTIPGAGKMGRVFRAYDRLIATKNSGLMFRWDGYNLVDVSTKLGPSSPYSVAEKEGYYFWLNRDGHFGYGGVKPQLLSNAVQPQIYNDSGSAVAGTTFTTAPATTHRYDYYVALGGSLTDDFANQTITNPILKYNYQKNEYLNYSFYNQPTAWHSYRAASGVQTLIFGDAGGQCYTFGGTALSDNGHPIESKLEFDIHLDTPVYDKKWNWLWAYFNPGCQAQMQIAIADSYADAAQRWVDLGDLSSGVARYRFPAGSRGKLLFVKIHDSSTNARFMFQGITVSAEAIII